MFPGVPTLVEMGYKDFDREGYFGLAFPAKTPPALADKIYKATAAAVKTQGMQNSLVGSGLHGVGSSPKDFGEVLQDDLDKQAAIIKRLRITQQ